MAGKTYYVSGTGSDKNDGLKEGQAFRTLQAAANLVQAGDTVYVMNGTYEEKNYPTKAILSINKKHGTQSAPITFTAYPGHNPVLKSANFNAIDITGSSYIVIEGLTLIGANDRVTLAEAQSSNNNEDNVLTNGNGIHVSTDSSGQHSTHLVFRNNNVSKFSGGGITTVEADYITIENNVVSECGWYSFYGTQGISLLKNYNSDDNTSIYKNIIRGNITHNNYNYIPWVGAGEVTEGHGIMIDNGNVAGLDGEAYKGKTLITNNISYKNGGAGIQVYNSANVDVVNNTTYQNSQHPDLAGTGEIFINKSSATQVLNNLMYAKEDGSSYVVTSSSTGIKADSNLIYNTDPYNKAGTNFILGKDPLFVNVADGDFRLKSGSPAIDTGSNALNSVTKNVPQDGDGNGIAVIDVGAYEAPRTTIATPEIQVLNGTVDIADESTTAINFGETTVGNTLTKTFTIKNTGIATLNLSNLELPDGFSLVGTLPKSVAVNASTSISVVLNTTTVGVYSGSFSLNNNDSNESPFNFAISGTVKPAPAPEIQVLNGAYKIADGSTGAISFGNTSAGNTLTKTFTIQNIGTAALNLSNLELPDGFSLVGTLPKSVAANASTNISVVLKTITPGDYSGSFSLNNNDSDESPFNFAISGTIRPATGINGDAGNNKLSGGEPDDRIWGKDGNDQLYGNGGKDLLYGDNGNDTLFGGVGNDQLYGGAGIDWLYGGKGNDVLTGGYNPDTFVLASGEGTDSITDFEIGKDKLALSGGLKFGQLLIQNEGSQTFILNSSDNQVLAKLDGISATTLLAQASTTFMTI
ncbi:MAG: choice-of-anchor D domain-containing protein [Nostoc sp.]|uniref:choice-of-anchor D domain-containing protein n=1 Tax=Nostoc sp. TaxID=1180 RepID=UPI002FF70CC8